jgi:hypothetical protein
VRLRHIGRRAAAEQLQTALELGTEQPEHSARPFLAARREPPEDRPARADRSGAERERLQHVGAAPDPAVEEHLDPLTGGLGDLGQDVQRGRHPVELAAAVVRDDHR